MNVLGLNGWTARSHDAAACVIVDGTLCAALEEERPARRKHAFDRVPLLATLRVLEIAGLEIQEVGCLAYGWSRDHVLPSGGDEAVFLAAVLPESVFRPPASLRTVFVSHHLAHAYHGYYSSPFAGEPAAVVVVDGQGEASSLSIGGGSSVGVTLDRGLPASSSLGYMYEGLSRLLGYSSWECGKVMGLAALSEALSCEPTEVVSYSSGQLHGVPSLSAHSYDIQEECVSWWQKKLGVMFNLPRRRIGYKYSSHEASFSLDRDASVPQAYLAAAHTVQSALEIALGRVCEEALERNKTDKLVVCGGVAQNCSAMRAVGSSLGVDLHVPSAPADSGVAIGAALYACHELGVPINLGSFRTPFLGRNFTDAEIVGTLNSVGVSSRKAVDVETEVAGMLASGKVLGWFQGRDEFGPRALGARSVLADPRLPDLRVRINQLKGREPWRPVAVSALGEDCLRYFRDLPSPYMTRAVRVTDGFAAQCPGVVHSDGSCRPQLVTEKWQPRFAALLRAFGKISGLAVLANTSFNREDEPLTHTPIHALRTFISCPLDALILGDHVIQK